MYSDRDAPESHEEDDEPASEAACDGRHQRAFLQPVHLRRHAYHAGVDAEGHQARCCSRTDEEGASVAVRERDALFLMRTTPAKPSSVSHR